MKKITIHTNEYPTMAEIHHFLTEELDFPPYYGNNFDALFDCLTDLTEETEIRLIPRKETDPPKEFGILEKVLADAAKAQPCLTVIIENR